jgi:gliding motility-associated-like protein
MEPICTNVGLTFTANSGVAEASTTDPGNDYDCLITQPNPTWYYLEVASNGNIDMNLTAASDIDYIIWGPFSSLSVAQANCGDLGNPSSEIIDCSFSPTNNEFPSIPGALTGQVYVMLITNYANVVQDVTLTQVGGSGSTDCSIITNPPCAISAFNVNVSGCEFTTNTYDIAGSIEFTDPPLSGSLIVEDCNGNMTTVASFPFPASPLNFNLLNLASNGLPCDVTAYFTADLTCTQVYNYVAPLCIANCPTYDLNASSPNEACGNQVYSLEVQNLGCDGYVEFNVLGNYGSAWANEITWQVTSNLSGNIVASGGPGVDGANFNVSTGQMDPAVQGYIYTLQIDDAFGDGFTGSGGSITIQQNAIDIITPITGDFGFGQTIMFQAPLVVSTSTMTVLTPSGPVSSVMGNCQDHEVQFTLDNTNYCTAVQIDLPWTIMCDVSGTLIASGIHTVTVYPQVPDQASDVVSVTWNAGTCSWDVSPNNDCSTLDIGTLFNITPDPTGISNYCATGNEVFSVDYIGLAGSPNCCSTAGPSIPITYTTAENQTNATVVNSPFGGVNNSAFIDIAPNGNGGNATSATLTVSYTGYCENIASTTGDDMWVTVYLDGFIIYDQQQTTANFSTTLTLANMPWGYNENSVIEVFYYPNQLGSTVYSPATPCGSLALNNYNFSALNVSLDVVFDQMTPTPVSCALPLTSAYTCCTINPIVANAPANVTVACPSAVPAVNIAAVTGIVSDCPTVVTHLSDVSSGTCPQTITRTYRVTDACSNVLDVVQTITISAPTVSMPANGSSTIACASSAVMPMAPTVLDNCGRTLSVAGPTVSPDPACAGVKTYSFTYTDCAGITYPWVYTYTISAPVVSMPANGSSTVACVASATAPVAPTVLENCGRTLTVSAPVVSPDPACAGNKTYTYTYTDCSSATYSWIYTYTISAPVVSMPANGSSTVACVSSATAPVAPTVLDNCGRTLTVSAPVVSPDPACAGNKTYTYTYTDCASATYSWVYTYTISAPVVSMPANGSSTVACASNATAPLTPTVLDNCGRTLSVSAPVVSPDPACAGNKTYTYTYTDCAGATYSWVYTYTISAPVVSMPANGSSTVACASNATTPVTPTVLDNCGRTLSVSAPVVSPDPACAGNKTYTYTYTDCAGATYSWVYTYTISAPVVSMPANGSSTIACVSSAVMPVAPSVLDNCGRTLSVSGPMVSLDPSCAGIKTYTFTYTDCAGATYPWVYTYTISAPVVVMPANGSSNINCSTLAVAPVVPTVTDNCGRTLTVSAPVISALPACVGTQTYTYTFTDCGGLTYPWVYTYNINDNVLPTASNPATTTVPGGPAPAVNVAVVIDEADNCSTPVVAFVSESTDGAACPETITRIYSVTDACGNTINVTHTILITDPFVPTASNPAPIAVQCAADVPVPDVAVVTDEADNNGVPVVAWVSDVSDNGSCPEIITRTYSVTDACANTINVTQTITIHDVTNPVLAAAPANVTVECVGDVPAMTNLTWTDNCDGTGSVAGTDGALVGGSCGGTITRTWTYTDACGNSATTTQTITVDDNTAPVLAAAPSDITVQCIGDVPAMVNVTWTDNCDGTGSVAGTDGALVGGSCGGTITRTWTYTDACGNTASASQTITVNDNIAPVLAAAPANLTVECIGDIPAMTNLSWTDNCDGAGSVAGTDGALVGGSCGGTITRTWTYTDACGNNATATQTITVDDNTLPVLAAAPANVTVECLADVPAMTNLTWTDNCDGIGSVAGTDGALVGGSCGGTITRTWTYTDACGNNATTTQTITVDDNTLPTASNPATTTVPGGPAPAVDITVVIDEADNCSTPVVAFVSESTDGAACPETITRIYSVTDACGNTINVTHTILITDPFVPTASNPTPIAVQCATDVPVPDVAVVTDEADNNGVPVVAWVSDVSDNGSCPEIITRTYSVTDACANTITVTQTITIHDVTNPVLAAAPTNVTVECVGDVPAMVNLTWTDNCDGTGSVAGTDGALVGGSCGGTITRTWTYTDACGNSATTTQTITVDDNTAPVLAAAPSDITVQCIGDVPAMVNVTWTDNCDGTGSVAGTDGALVGGSCGGTITRTWTYTDACGNTASASQTITVNDNVAPVLAAAPANVTVECIGDVPAMTNLSWTDNCDGAGSVAGTDGSLVGGSCGGSITRTWTYTDACGNNATATQTITVDDNTLPVLAAAPANVTVECLADVPAMTNLTWTDNCDGTGSVAGTDGALVGGSCGGTITRTWTYTDACGNNATTTQTITVDDNTLPTASNPATTTVPGGPAPAVDITVVIDEADNCSTPVVAFVSESTDGAACPETITRIYSVTDACGNTINVTHTILITDPFVPTASNPAPIAVQCAADVPAVDVTVVTDEADNNGVPVVAWVSDVSDNGSCPEIITRTYSVTDACANTITVTQTITIHDVTNPVLAAAPANVTVECVGDVPAMTNLTWTDNCDGTGSVAGTDGALVGGSCGGTITRTWTYIDACGNIGTVLQTITINDNTPPTASNPTTITLDPTQSIPAADISVITDAADNCTTPAVTWVSDVSDNQKCPETITRTYAVTDACGNEILVTQLIIINSGCEIVIPTAFTPNGDLSNDFWEIVDIDYVHPKNKVFVYNRWGNMIYESEEGDYSSNPWDGTIRGEELPVASYYYIIYLEGDKSGEILNGTVSIIKN